MGAQGVEEIKAGPNNTELSAARDASRRDFESYVRRGNLGQGLSAVPAVTTFLQSLVKRRAFAVGHLRRELVREISRQCSPEAHPAGSTPPDGNEVAEMVGANPQVFQSGDSPLPMGSHGLKPRIMAQWHARFCSSCRWHEDPDQCRIDPGCYFTNLQRCVERGWSPPFYTYDFRPPYQVAGNYPATAMYAQGVEKELIGSMLANKAIRPSNWSPSQVVHPLGAVIKNSDKVRARVLLGITVEDQATLEEANERFLAMGASKIKVRVTMDCTATGANGAVVVPRFSYPGIRSGIDMVRRNAVLGVSDVSRYFHSFPWALEMRDKMKIQWDGQLYECWGLSFGFALCPYYCSAFSAEFRVWVKHLIGECAHMVDDWLLQGMDLAEVQRKCRALADLFESIGLAMATEKNKYGTSVKFLGIILDTVEMRMRIDDVQAHGTRLMLEEVRLKVKKGQVVGRSTWYHLAGKLNWFAEVVQSGRLHTHVFWDFLRHGDERRVPRPVRERMLSDVDWWITLLRGWEKGTGLGGEYRIWSAAEITTDPRAVYVVQSDASGEDGLGYAHGYLDSESVRFYGSRQWRRSDHHGSSHSMELTALLACLSDGQMPDHPMVVLWLTDSTSAALSVNKGNCSSPEGFEVLSAIFEIADSRGYEILAMWLPREENVLADYLSHLAAVCCRESITGTVSSLAEAATGGAKA